MKTSLSEIPNDHHPRVYNAERCKLCKLYNCSTFTTLALCITYTYIAVFPVSSSLQFAVVSTLLLTSFFLLFLFHRGVKFRKFQGIVQFFHEQAKTFLSRVSWNCISVAPGIINPLLRVILFIFYRWMHAFIDRWTMLLGSSGENQ